MNSLGAGLGIGLSALQSGQTALDFVGQNVANANTTGYSTQNVSLVTQVAGTQPTGVAVAKVTRSTDDQLQGAIFQSNGDSSLLTSRIATQTEAQSFIDPSSDAIDTQLSNLFSNITELTANPSSSAQQQTVVASAQSLAQQFNTVSSNLAQQQASVAGQIQQTVGQINQLTPQIATLNQKIALQNAEGQNANSLLDQRDALVNQLSNLTNIQVTTLGNGTVDIQSGNAPLVDGPLSGNLAITSGANGAVTITETNSGETLDPTSGTLGGLVQDNNVSLPGYQSQLNTLAQSLAAQFDEVQATGLNSTGPLTSVNGTRAVSDPTATLASQNLPIPAQAGTLYISVTNTATGQQSLDSVAIDPTTQSLQDVANAISTATGNQVQGSVNATTNTLQLQAASGYTFDFAGTIPETPATANLNGTTTPQITGSYTGTSNDTYSFQVQGSGTIGTTAGLQLQVTNSENNGVATVNVGSGYTPGTPINIGNGLSVSLSAGTSNNGTFSTPVIANPDSSGILASLGVNSLFTGTNASDIAVNSSIVANPSLLNSSTTGQAGDTSNLQRFAAIQNADVLSGGTQTLGGYFSSIVSSVGTEISNLTDQQTAQTTLAQNLQTQSQSVTSVDVNAQMVQLLSYQQMMDSASKYLSVVNSTIQSVINIIQ